MDRITQVVEAVINDPLVYLPLIGAWFITELYFIVNFDENHGHTYVMSTGIALIFTAFMVSPFAADQLSLSFPRLQIAVTVALFLYGFFLVFFGILRMFPHFLAEFFGAPGHAMVPSMMAVLFIHHGIPFDRTTFLVLVTPVLLLAFIKTFKRLSYRIHTSVKKRRDSMSNTVQQVS